MRLEFGVVCYSTMGVMSPPWHNFCYSHRHSFVTVQYIGVTVTWASTFEVKLLVLVSVSADQNLVLFSFFIHS